MSTEKSVSERIASIMKKKHQGNYYQGTAPPLERIRCGIPGLDRLMGGGLPCGRVVELFSDPSGGKTTTAIYIMLFLLNVGYDVAYVDMERTVDQKRLEELGVSGDNFHYFRPNTGVEAIEITREVVAAGAKLVIIDSVPFLGTDAAYEADTGKQVMAPQAVLLSRCQHQIIPALEQNEATLLFINQTRNKIGAMGNPIDSSGGNALKFMCSIRLYMTRAGSEKDGSGFTIRYQTKKNKTAPEKRTCLVDLKFDSGLDPYSSVRETLIETNKVYIRGAYYYFDETFAKELGFEENNKIGQGKNSVRKLLESNPDLYEMLYQKILEMPLE